MKKIQAVIFDLNGVFIKSRLLSERFQEDFGVPEGEFLPILKATLIEVRKPEGDDVYTYMKPHLHKWGVHFTRQEFYTYWFGAEQEAPEMIELARRLKQEGVKLFVLSNNFRARREYYDKHFHFLTNLFDAVYFSFESGYTKSQPEAFEMVLRAHNLDPKRVLFFDDSEGNVEVAKSLGIQAYVFEGEEATKKILEKATL